MNEFQQRYIAARRAVIGGDLRRLNPMQRKAAMTTEGPLLLLAGAGSGKTTVLIQRIYNLLTYGRGSDCEEVPEGASEEDLAFLESFPERPAEAEVDRARRLCAVDVPRPWEIIAITFTNKAAGELKERLAARLGPMANDIWASTFHSACVRILRRDIDRLGFDRSFTIYDTDDSKRVLKDLIKELELDEKAFSPKFLLGLISAAKDRYQSPEEFAAACTGSMDWRLTRAARVYGAYQGKLKSANALDFDDIIYYTVQLLQQEPEVLEFYQKKFRYVCVDEYQDTNHIQYLLTSLLAGGRENLCVVGDDDQSIYRFRGANIENILSFEKQYPKARVIRLEQNYRSTQNILDAANGVIKNNTSRKGKTLWTDNGAGDKVRIRTCFNEGDEAAFAAGDILASVSRGHHFREAAVLYRMNAQSNALEYAMRRNGIPYKVVGGVKFFDRAEVKDMLAYLCVLNNPLDDLRLRRIINNPARGIGNATMDKAALLAGTQQASLYEIIRNADLFPELKSSASRLLKFADLIDGLRRRGGELALPEFYDEVCEQSGYVKALKDRGDAESQSRLENVRELKSNILGFLERSPEDATLSGFLNEIALYTDLDGVNLGDDCVTMMTIHAAKGLEFPTVYVVGMEEGVFPGNSVQYSDEDLEEERRLCYVAMTRAKEKLILTHCRQRMLYGRTSSNPVSRFLEEIPEEKIRWENRPAPRYGGGDGEFGGGRWGTPSEPVHQQAGGQGGISLSTAGSASKGTGSAAQEPMLQLEVGDLVEHTAFGQGRVTEVQIMPGDVMASIRFGDEPKPRRLMLKFAGKHMKKL